MKIKALNLSGLSIITPDVHPDERGFFMETYNEQEFKNHGIDEVFVQDNQSHSKQNVLRGMKFQWDPPTTKLVRVAYGKIFAVAADIRVDSPTLGEWEAVELSDENHQMLYIPFGYAFGFCVLSEKAGVAYKLSALHNQEGAGCIRWDDPDLSINWPIENPIISPADSQSPTLKKWLTSDEAQVITMRSV